MNFKYKIPYLKSRGFTLIELMVVIAIIALLASIVLSSLNAATNTANDNSVKAGLRELSSQIQLDATMGYFATGMSLAVGGGWGSVSVSPAYCGTPSSGSFGPWTLFVGDSKITQIMANIVQNAGSTPVRCAMDSTGTKWAISINTLKGTPGLGWCIDNSGDFRNTSGGLLVTTPATSITGMCP